MGEQRLPNPLEYEGVAITQSTKGCLEKAIGLQHEAVILLNGDLGTRSLIATTPHTLPLDVQSTEKVFKLFLTLLDHVSDLAC